MVFGGLKGLNFFYPEDIKPLPQPKTVLTDYKVSGTSLNYGTNKNSPLQKDIAFADNITDRYNKNVITIEYAGIDFSKEKSLLYRYKLEGFNNNWNYAGTDNTASFTNLPPGTYKFIVQASTKGITWGEANTQLQLIIVPLWWQTWWFKSLILISSVGLFYSIYRYRVNQLLTVERVRNRIASDLHDEIGSTLSAINIYSRIAHVQSKTEESKTTPLIEKIADNTAEAMQAMSEIVWSINTKNDKFENIITRMQALAAQVLEAKDYKVHFNAEESAFNVNLKMQKRRDFYLIYKEAINNIAKYAQGRNVWIHIQLRGKRLILSVKDDGVGFNKNNVSKESNGLINMHQRAAAINGKMKITSEIEKGTIIELIFVYN